MKIFRTLALTALIVVSFTSVSYARGRFNCGYNTSANQCLNLNNNYNNTRLYKNRANCLNNYDCVNNGEFIYNGECIYQGNCLNMYVK